MKMWTNPSCSRCAAAREFLDEAGVAYEPREYLTQPPTADELADVLDRLGLQPWDITRLTEPRAAELEMSDWPRERDRWIAALADNPILIQRPILITDDGRAVIGRDDAALRAAVRDDDG